MKNFLQWNVRSVVVDDRFTSLLKSLPKYGFHKVSDDKSKSMYVSKEPSSYFMKAQKNSIAIGMSSPGLVLTYPWLIQGKSNSLEDYSLNDLKSFNLVYLSEPEIKDVAVFQQIVEKLAEAGKTVIIEMGGTNIWPIFGIIPYQENIPENARLVSTDNSPFETSFDLQADINAQVPAMSNLDGTWMEMKIPDGKRVPAVGFKNVHGNKVYFVGLRLGSHLNSETKWSGRQTEESADGKDIEFIERKSVDKYCAGSQKCDDEENKIGKIINAVKGCDAVLALRIGYRPLKTLEEAGIKVFQTCGNIEDCVKNAALNMLNSGMIAQSAI
jgi:predicted Fe-Mo cluster-binding NifX family protein